MIAVVNCTLIRLVCINTVVCRYSGQVCAPSRTTLMTGRHLGHTTIRGNDGAYTPLLKTDVTVAKVLKDAGYRTGLVGKWGLGNFGTSGILCSTGYCDNRHETLTSIPCSKVIHWSKGLITL